MTVRFHTFLQRPHPCRWNRRMSNLEPFSKTPRRTGGICGAWNGDGATEERWREFSRKSRVNNIEKKNQEAMF